jgi:translation elongation factor EF-Ts
MATPKSAKVIVELNETAFSLNTTEFDTLADNFAQQVKEKIKSIYTETKAATLDDDKGHIDIDIDW